MEKRKHSRFKDVEELSGKLYNVINFRVQDLSPKGISLICGLVAQIGTIYSIFLCNDDDKKDFRIKIIRSEAFPMDEKYADLRSDGMLYLIGAEFIDMNSERERYLDDIIHGSIDFNGVFFVEQD